MSDNKEIDGNKVLAIIQKHNPEVLERAVLMVQIEELQAENEALRKAVSEGIGNQTTEG